MNNAPARLILAGKARQTLLRMMNTSLFDTDVTCVPEEHVLEKIAPPEEEQCVS